MKAGGARAGAGGVAHPVRGAPRGRPAGIHTDEGTRLLASPPVFHGLTADERGELCRRARHREVPARATVCAPADAGGALHVLGRGRVCV